MEKYTLESAAETAVGIELCLTNEAGESVSCTYSGSFSKLMDLLGEEVMAELEGGVNGTECISIISAAGQACEAVSEAETAEAGKETEECISVSAAGQTCEAVGEAETAEAEKETESLSDGALDLFSLLGIAESSPELPVKKAGKKAARCKCREVSEEVFLSKNPEIAETELYRKVASFSELIPVLGGNTAVLRTAAAGWCLYRRSGAFKAMESVVSVLRASGADEGFTALVAGCVMTFGGESAEQSIIKLLKKGGRR